MALYSFAETDTIFSNVNKISLLSPRGSPAHAGMDPQRVERQVFGVGLPRPRGDGPS